MKSTKLITLFCALALMTACGNNPPDLEDRVVGGYGEDLIEYSGVIESLTALDVYQQGTHLLRPEEGDPIIIQSSTSDLSHYLGKAVVIRAEEAKRLGNAERVLNVIEIKLQNGLDSGDVTPFENGLYGFSMTYPSAWELTDAAEGITLVFGEDTKVSIEIYGDKTDLDGFTATQEEAEGTAVTVAAQRSLRFIHDSNIRVYVPNPPKKKIYRISFNESGTATEAEVSQFYDLLESIQLIYSTAVKKGGPCGGPENTKCEAGFFCELASAEADAIGSCMALDGGGADGNCPFIAVPTDCRDYRIAEYSATGCPRRYECVLDSESLRAGIDIAPTLDRDALTGTIEKYQDSILKVKGAVITGYDIDESQSMVAVTYTAGGNEYVTAYEYEPSANEFNFTEKSHTVNGKSESEAEDETSTGPSASTGTVKEVAVGTEERVTPDSMTLYENTHREFSLLYPKSWYFRSFGAINDTRWLVGFGEKEVDLLSDAQVTVSILDSAPESSSGYTKVVHRDEDSVFVVEGPNEMKDIIDEIAASIR